MNVLVNVFHPQISHSTVNSSWISALEKSDKVTLNLLYSRYPDWEIDVDREQRLLLANDRIVFQHPFFWYSSPPLMKKWLDDVLTFNWAYGPEGTALQGKEWVSAISTGVKSVDYQAGGDHNFSMSELLKPIQQTANLVGMRYLTPYVFHNAIDSSAFTIQQSAKKYVHHITNELNKRNINVENGQHDNGDVCSTLDY